MIGAGELGEVVVNADLALDDLLEHGLVLVNGPVLEAPGVGRQTNSALGRAQGGELAAVVGPIAAVSGGQSLLSSRADALEGGGDDGVGGVGLVDVHADDSRVVRGSSSGDGVEDGAAAGEDDLGAVLVPAGGQGLQLSGGLEALAVFPGVVHLDLDVLFGCSSLGALNVTVAVTAAGIVRAAATAAEAELGVAFHDGSIAGQVAALLFTGADGSEVGHAVDGRTVNEHELGVREFLRGLLEGSALQEAGGHNDLCAVVDSGLHGVVTIVIGGLVAVGGLIVLVGLAVGIGVQLHAVVSALVEGLVLQIAHVGDERDLILAIAGRHFVRDVVCLHSRFFAVVFLARVLIVLGTAGAQRKDHDEREEQSNELLHVHAIFSSIKILPDIRVVFCCVFTTVFSITRAGIASNPICFENIKKI